MVTAAAAAADHNNSQIYRDARYTVSKNAAQFSLAVYLHLLLFMTSIGPIVKRHTRNTADLVVNAVIGTPLLSARPKITFPAAENRLPFGQCRIILLGDGSTYA